MNEPRDDLYYMMNVLAAVVLWPITLIVLCMALLVGINPLTWIGGFLVWLNKKVN